MIPSSTDAHHPRGISEAYRISIASSDHDRLLARIHVQIDLRIRSFVTIPPLLGLIPAAGRAERLGPLPCSKELLPIGFRETPRGPAPKVAGHYLLERFRAAGVRRVFMVLHESKQDVPRYFGTGEIADVALAYLSIPGSRSVPETLDRAFPFVEEAIVALGFPDVLFEPVDAYAPLIARQAATGADLVLGLFPTERHRTTDMVELDADGPGGARRGPAGDHGAPLQLADRRLEPGLHPLPA